MAEKLKLAFVGDVNFSGIFREKLLKGEEVFSPEVLEVLAAQDFVVANFEGPATLSPPQKSKGISLNSPPEAIPYLVQRNIKVFNLANNHLFDHGAEGFDDTVKLIEQHGGHWFGAGHNLQQALKPLLLSANGVSRGLLGIAHQEGMTATADSAGVLCETHRQEISKAVKDYQQNGAQLIINYHGGEEYTRYPAPGRRMFLSQLAINAQAWVIAHHSHTLQGVEHLDGQQVFYSLGNFVFDLPMQASRSFVRQSAILLTKFDDEGGCFSWLPVHIDTQTGLIAARDKDNFETEMATLSDWENYDRHWPKDAHRVFWMTRSSGGAQPDSNVSPNSAPNAGKGVLKKVFRPTAWKALWGLFGNPHTRPIAMGAIKHILTPKNSGNNAKG